MRVGDSEVCDYCKNDTFDYDKNTYRYFCAECGQELASEIPPPAPAVTLTFYIKPQEKMSITPRLHQVLTETELNEFLQQFPTAPHADQLPVQEIKDSPLYGDYVQWAGYKFKVAYSMYQCQETPTEKIQPPQMFFKKAPGDHYKK